MNYKKILDYALTALQIVTMLLNKKTGDVENLDVGGEVEVVDKK